MIGQASSSRPRISCTLLDPVRHSMVRLVHQLLQLAAKWHGSLRVGPGNWTRLLELRGLSRRRFPGDDGHCTSFRPRSEYAEPGLDDADLCFVIEQYQ